MQNLLVLALASISLLACKKSDAPASGATGSAAATPATTGTTATGAPTATGSSTAPAAAGGDPACLAGAWTSKVGDKNVYTFKADKTGDRVHESDPSEGFTWSMKDPTTAVVVFPEHGDHKRAEFEFSIDCAVPEIKFQNSIPFVKS